MCATCSSVLVLPRSSWCVWAVNRRAPPQPARMRPACSSLSSLPGVAGRSLSCLPGVAGRSLSSLPGVAGQGFALACVRLACARAVFARVWVCVRAACCVRVRCWRACARGAAHDSCTFCDGHSEAGEFVDVEVREFVGVRKRKECPQVATPSEEPIPVEIYWFTKSCCLSEVKKFTYPRTTHTHT